MSERFFDLNIKASLISTDLSNLYHDVIEAYHKGEITCTEYLDLYDKLLDILINVSALRVDIE